MKPGAYQLELFDGEAVTLMRRLEVEYLSRENWPRILAVWQ